MAKNKHTRSQIAGRWLLGWTLFIGIGAVAGASGMLLDPSGKAALSSAECSASR